MRSPILGMGGLQVTVTTLVVMGIGVLLGVGWRESLAIGLILALSSTAIALQILDEKNLMKTEAGKASFAVLLFQDIAVIPIIALLPLLAVIPVFSSAESVHGANAIEHMPGWQQTMIVFAAVAGIILAGRYLMRPVFRFIAQSHLREMFTAIALLLVIGIALLMQMVGLSPALGAFIAGVVLANNEYRHELEANIDPFKALLLGLFFISVGAGIDFALLVKEFLLIGGIVLGLVVLKFTILWGLTKLFTLEGGGRYWFAFALAQGGEFGFVLLSFSAQNLVLPRDTVDILTVAIALSMVLTPILILLNEKLVQPRFQSRDGEVSLPENMMEEQDTPVIIAGFGRFGQIVGRLLMANGTQVTVLDHSAPHIERVRRFGFKVFYGDASRSDLLHIAGAGKAKLLVVAVDDRGMAHRIIETARQHFPHLKIFARAYDVIHYHELQKLEVDYIEREMFLGSLNVGEKALQALGMRAYQARRMTQQFAAHDQATIELLGKLEQGSGKYVSEAKRAQAEVLDILQADRLNQRSNEDHAWDATGHE